MVDEVVLERFKRIEHAELPLSKINIFVGGNNSGKSCILQGIHFGVALAQARAIAGFDQFPPEKLRYCPTDDFLNLCRGQRLNEGTSISVRYIEYLDGEKEEAQITLKRGRNGVVKAQSFGRNLIRIIADPKGFFSIYVPGLAGISLREEYRSELVVNNGIARGDANLFLRNLLLRIEKTIARKQKFIDRLNRVFPGCKVFTYFRETDDLVINSEVELPTGALLPIDMVGTGMLQAIQLVAYITMYEPRLLLLDEPDAHLHPTNQKLLADTLLNIVEGTRTKVLIATHSRHLLDAFSDCDDARLFWVRDGAVKLHNDWSDLAVLMDLGALDRGERLMSGQYKYLFWTEDDDKRFIETFIKANGIESDEAFIFSYKASSKVDAAKLMAAFVSRMRPGVVTIIHRDRDFMLDHEVERMRDKFSLNDTDSSKLFITKGSDIESYFVNAAHISHIYGLEYSECETMLQRIVQENQNEFIIKYQSKRNEIKSFLYKKDPENCPSVEKLIPGSILPIENAMGKMLERKLRLVLQQRNLDHRKLMTPTPALIDQGFKSLLGI